MRTRGLASLVTCLLLAYGCGGTTANNDARDAKDSGPDLPVDRPADGGGTGGGGGSGGSDAKDGPIDVPGSDMTVDGVDGGGPPPCTVASECPGQDSECRHRVCAAGVCGMANEATGKVLSAQTVGDCKVRACGADGLPAVGNDDLDKPDDLNPCTNDICTNGTASHTNAAAATACGNGKMCNATGQCVGCTVATDCPGTDNECRTRTCIQSTCGVTFKAAGTKVADTTPGDCKGRQCDGQGVIQVVDLSTDVPTDDNACTVDQCNGGTPNHGPSPRNSSCGGGKICDGASHCVACLTAATCPGADSDCQTRVCTAGVCGVANAANGKAVTSQTAGDCKKDQCNGQGVVVSVNDDTDTHNDNNACTNDVCTAGVPSNPPKAAQVVCGANLKCDGAGQCVGCLNAAECGTNTECVSFACTAGMCVTSFTAVGTAAGTQVAKDCKKKQCDGAGNIAEVDDNTDVPVDTTVCTADVCTAGVPSNPAVPVGMACTEGGGMKCNGNGACVACIAPADCGTDTVCKKFTCSPAGVCGRADPPVGTDAGGQTAGDCKKKVCDGAGAESPTPQDDNTDLPDDSNVCTANTCVTGMPTFPPANEGNTCGSGSMPQFCVAGQCTGGCNVPADCGTDSTCRTYTCVSNMCGHTDAAMTVMLPAGEQTAGDCKTSFCNGTGGVRTANEDTDLPVDNNACTTDVCTAGVSSHGFELAGKTCSTGGIQCDGAGTCGPVVTLVVVNEVTSNNPDRFELYNTSATVAVDISGWVMKDDTDTGATHIFVFPANTVLQPHQFKDFLSATFLVGLGSADQVRLFAADGTTLITSVAWTNHPTWTGQPTATWGRCPDGSGPFRLNATATAEAANDCSMTAPAAPLPPTSSP